MRGRTNISTGTDMTVNGEVITATAVENIQAREFVSYEINAQIKELLNVNFLPYDSNSDVKVSGNLIYALSSYNLYVFESTNDGLALKSVYSDYIILAFEIISPNYVVIVTSSKTAMLSDSKLITLSQYNGILTYVAEISNPFYSGNSSVLINYENEKMYMFSPFKGDRVSSSSNLFQYYISIAVYQCNLPNELSLISQNDKAVIASRGQTLNFKLYKTLFCNGKFAFFTQYRDTGELIKNDITFGKIIVNNESLDVQENEKITETYYYDFAFAYSKWIVCGESNNGYSGYGVSAPSFDCINTETLQRSIIQLKTLGFDKSVEGDKNVSGIVNYSRLSLSKISEDKLFVAVLLYRTFGWDFCFDCGVLYFDKNTGTFRLSGNILDLKPVFSEELDSTTDSNGGGIKSSCFFAGKYYVLERHGSEYKFSYVEIPESNGALSLPVDKNKVKKYDGGTAIGFSKTAAKANEEIQVYIPKIEGGD